MLPDGALPDGNLLELHVELYAYTPFFNAGEVAVGESSNIIDT